MIERITGFERRAEDIMKAAEREHDSIRANLADVRHDLELLEQAIAVSNLDKLPSRVEKLEDANARRLGAQLGAKTMLTVYLGGVLAVVGFLYEVAVKVSHG